MKTIKEMSTISGVSVRTLRYYDEINLLKPTRLTEAGYRLYDNKALERLQEIMFFKELEIPLADIKQILENPNYDKEQTLLTQKILLEQKRNRLNGIIELINDIMKGVNTMSFEAFTCEETKSIIDHMFKCISKESLEKQIQKYGTLENYRTYLISGFSNEQAMADVFKWYGGKDKALAAIMQSDGDTGTFTNNQDEVNEIYKKFMEARKTNNPNLEQKAVCQLATCYKELFKLDNARNILLDLAGEYLQNQQLAKATDSQYGEGCSEYVAYAIQRYYGK